ncbi:MAG: N-acetyltransferase [Gammaproteobacteria bacterium]|nr:N-acetyltransferase [Gammaproteobacteria bacterium]MBU1440256.1 N-acetyltransferase [Gammaproteobacteria bacterium]MBU2286398.1 N-acetyltransferase [Gammaproteobacteria bacterium]MBU2407965.1 N-acetyltransferase [Gammaproteobacteria bacterium]
MTDIAIQRITEHNRYEATIDGRLAGQCEYNLLREAIMFTHTEVMPEFEGRGVGSALARHVLDAARAEGLHVIPVCTFIAGWIRKHPEYADLVREDMRRAFNI